MLLKNWNKVANKIFTFFIIYKNWRISVKINSVSSISFEARNTLPRKIYVSSSSQGDIQNLLQKMKLCSKYSENAARTKWQSEELASVEIAGNVKFIDNSLFLQSSQKCGKYPDCSVEMGNDRLDIDSTTGEVIGYRKGFFTGLRNFIIRAENGISAILSNFDNPEKVKKNTIPLCGYTKKGLEIFQKKYYT